jgi:hypothetical protein
MYILDHEYLGANKLRVDAEVSNNHEASCVAFYGHFYKHPMEHDGFGSNGHYTYTDGYYVVFVIEKAEYHDEDDKCIGEATYSVSDQYDIDVYLTAELEHEEDEL